MFDRQIQSTIMHCARWASSRHGFISYELCGFIVYLLQNGINQCARTINQLNETRDIKIPKIKTSENVLSDE